MSPSAQCPVRDYAVRTWSGRRGSPQPWCRVAGVSPSADEAPPLAHVMVRRGLGRVSTQDMTTREQSDLQERAREIAAAPEHACRGSMCNPCADTADKNAEAIAAAVKAITPARRRVLAWLDDGATHTTRERGCPSEAAIKSAAKAGLVRTNHVAHGGGAYDLEVGRTRLGRAVAAVMATPTAPRFRPVLTSDAYRLDLAQSTHVGWISTDEPLTYLTHTPMRKGPARVRVESRLGAFYVDADRLVAS